LCVLLITGAGWFSFRFFAADSPHRAAKRYFRDSFTAGVINERMSNELDRMNTAVAVQALAELIEEQNSRWAEWYDVLYNKAPAKLRSRLSTPTDHSRVVSRSIEMLGRFGSEGAPAVPALIRIYQRVSPGRDLRSPAAAALGRIGPPASNAIPVLLPDLNPTNRSLPSIVAGILIRIDPSGDQIDRDLRQLMSRPGHEQFAAKIAEESSAALVASEGTVMRLGRDKWFVAQILGLLRSEATNVVPVLIPLLDNEAERMRSIAAESLGRLGPAASNALPKLRLLLNDEWAMVREAASNAIRGIDRRRSQ
jgi:HEAT repeat protein